MDINEQAADVSGTPGPGQRAEDRSAEKLERLLLVTFLAVAAISVLWHLGTSLQWLWANCASQLHSAAMQAGIV